ncbi:MAG: esterase family protein [Acidobacteria bacterium]|nr:esterase family protein [Acidobacteriota bacterium]MCB9377462.1 esterase family protein [Holophagales bacterium]
MKKHLERIHSPQLGRGVSLWSYGHFGPPLLVFPTAAGFAHEWEAQGMVEALAPLLDAGKLKLYCPESNVAEAWTRRDNDAEWRIGRHVAYERFVVETLVPKIRDDCRSPGAPIGVAGCSLGAFYACNFALKHPEIFRWALCMSGRYAMTHFTDGFSNGDVYFNNPLAYVPGLSGEPLERIRRSTHVVLVCGQGPFEEGCIEETQALADLFESKGIPHQRDIWGHDVAHNWVWWKRQALLHLSRRLGAAA